MDNPLEITLDGPLLEVVRRLAANESMTVEDWVIARLTQSVALFRAGLEEPPN
jgi:hypothetical protein